MVKITYSDGQVKDYANRPEAEADILEVFAGSDGEVLPVQVEEVDALGKYLRDLSCDWKVTLLSALGS